MLQRQDRKVGILAQLPPVFLGGHADQRPQSQNVLERYNIIDEADLAEAARKLDEKKTDAPESRRNRKQHQK